MYSSISGLIVGAIIRYGGQDYEVNHIRVVPARGYGRNLSIPPDNLFFSMEVVEQTSGTAVKKENKTYAYSFQGEINDVENKKLDQKVGVQNCFKKHFFPLKKQNSLNLHTYKLDLIYKEIIPTSPH